MTFSLHNDFKRKTIYMMQIPELTEENEFIMVIADPRIYK